MSQAVFTDCMLNTNHQMSFIWLGFFLILNVGLTPKQRHNSKVSLWRVYFISICVWGYLMKVQEHLHTERDINKEQKISWRTLFTHALNSTVPSYFLQRRCMCECKCQSETTHSVWPPSVKSVEFQENPKCEQSRGSPAGFAGSEWGGWSCHLLQLC